MKLISKVTEIYCIADDFCKEYELELNKKALSLSNPSPNTPKTRNRKGRMSDAEMITILVLFHSNTFRNFKHFYLFYVCRELKEEFPNLLSYTRFVERMPRVADRGIHIVTGIRTNMKNRLMDEYDKIRLRKRSIIETINDMLKNVAQIVHTRHRSVSNFIVNLLAGMAAYAFYDTKPSINMEFEMEGEAEVKQLTLF
ncbi:MAG: hypothetical protein D8H91_01835 [Alloprevotella sp.]|nr:MAG: hypothetical protein D8H91_01835 [Alloprevotella sp.]